MDKKYISLLFGLIFIPIIIYWNHFGFNITSDHSRWAEYGAFWGGILGPILTLITIWILFLNLQQQKIIYNQQRFENIAFNHLEYFTKYFQNEKNLVANGYNPLNLLKNRTSDYLRIYPNSNDRKKENFSVFYNKLKTNEQEYFEKFINNFFYLFQEIEFLEKDKAINSSKIDFYIRMILNRISYQELEFIFLLCSLNENILKNKYFQNFGIINDIIPMLSKKYPVHFQEYRNTFIINQNTQ